MAVQKSPLKKGEKIEQGVMTSDKGVVIPLEQRESPDPENLYRTKAEFIAHQQAKKEKSLEVAKFSKEYDEKKRREKKAPKEEAPIAEKPKPKKKKS